jgi:hypothetical protein
MKKNFPITALEVLQPFVEKAKDIASPVVDEKHVLYLVDNDAFDKSDYFFKVIFELDGGTYRIEMKPYSSDTIIANAYRCQLGEIENFFTIWLDVMRRYKNQPSVHDNPAKYQAEYFYNEFKIVDEDADFAPFNPNQIFLLEEYIENYKTNLLILRHDENKESIDKIIEECNELQDTIYSEPKNKVMNAFAKIWGKTVTTLKKEGKDFIKEAWQEFKKDIIGKLTPLLTGGVGAVVAEVVKQIL